MNDKDDKMKALMERILGREEREPENLDPDLAAASVVRDGKTWLWHPCGCRAYEPRDHANLNDRLIEFQQRTEAALAEQEWEAFLEAYAKPFYPDALIALEGRATPAQWAALIRRAWNFSDRIWDNREKWKPILARAQAIPEWMDAQERRVIARQPDPITIYRGCLPEHAAGLSWSLEYDSAYIFAYRTKPLRGVIVTGTVTRANVIAYLENDECEIIALPEHVTLCPPEEYDSCY